MSPALRPCQGCGRHTAAAADGCAHCGVASPAAPASPTPTLAAALLGLALTGCSAGDDVVTALYGAPYVDDDNDGYQPPEDCDDNDETRHPGAEETPGDDIDSNCDGHDDT
jgi:hypothetical protein